MDSLFEKEIKIIDNENFWNEYKLEVMERDAYIKEDFHVFQNSKEGKSFMSFDVNISVPGRCMKYYMQGQAASAMAVKWISFCDGDSIYWCRSWTGYIVYRAQFIQEDDNYRIIKLFVCNDPEQVDCSYFKQSNKNILVFDFLLLLHPGKAIVPSMHMLGLENKMEYLAKKHAIDSVENAEDSPEVIESVIEDFMNGVAWACKDCATFPHLGEEDTFQSKLDKAAENYFSEILKVIEWQEPISDEDIQGFKEVIYYDFTNGAIKAIESMKAIGSSENKAIESIFGEGASLFSIQKDLDKQTYSL